MACPIPIWHILPVVDPSWISPPVLLPHVHPKNSVASHWPAVACTAWVRPKQTFWCAAQRRSLGVEPPRSPCSLRCPVAWRSLYLWCISSPGRQFVGVQIARARGTEMYVWMYLSIYLSIYLSSHLSIYLAIYLFLYLFIYLYICIYISLPLSLSFSIHTHSNLHTSIKYIYIYAYTIYIYTHP